jgi:hypothetical protein
VKRKRLGWYSDCKIIVRGKSMTKYLGSILLLFVICCPAFAVKVTGLGGTDTFIDRAKDIVVAECISISPLKEYRDGMRPVEVNIVKTLKGDKEPGHTQIVTIYRMEPNSTYLLYSLGGNVGGTDFLAIPQLSVVPLPRGFKLDELKDKELKEQVQYIFSRRLFELEQELRPMLEEKKLLEQAVSDRRSEWYESKAPVKIGPIVECNTQTDGTHIKWLDVDAKKLAWSQSSPGKSSFLGFQKMDISQMPYWEFSPCEANSIEDIVGKPLKARFYGMYTPGRGETSLRMMGLQSLYVNVRQMLLARTVDEPNKIFIIQIMSQKENQEQMSARYAVINP